MRKLLSLVRFFSGLCCVIWMSSVSALTFSLPNSPRDSLIGDSAKVITVSVNEDITELGMKYDIGYLEFAESNPGVDLDNLYAGEQLMVPSQFVLPIAPRQGIVINVAELRLYYYPPGQHTVITYPIGIGRENAVTPLVRTRVIEKRKDPIWVPTSSTRAEAITKGIMLPQSIEAGPDNPLGNYAMRMGVSTYLIHGTNDPSGVGIRSSAGCIRMYPEDIKELFSMVEVGTPVNIVNQADKVGWNGQSLVLESHVPLDHKQGRSVRELASVMQLFEPYIRKEHAELYWENAISVADSQLGIPSEVGVASGVGHL